MKTGKCLGQLFAGSIVLATTACGGGGGGGTGAPAPTPAAGNQAPHAENISVRSDLTSPYLSVRLQASDPDNDTLNFVLDTDQAGPGYDSAFIDPRTGELHVTLTGGEQREIRLPYKATDGVRYSNQANVTVSIGDVSEGVLGSNDMPADAYGRLERAFFDGDRFGSALGDETTLPRAIDLSGNFPTPGNQGQQGSCVAWATAYALKSYQEKIEEQWDFSESTTFSPAWVYNQINGGQDGGSMISDAMQLLVTKGAASWQSMPYNDQDYLTQPSAAAISEAAAYKAVEFRAISSVQQMKAALANRNPVVSGIEIFPSFETLQGPDSVYNSTAGGQLGGHAITLVGYDDDRYGGAFKIINSWGVNWGDNGFFWLPYDMIPQVMSQAFVLTDGTNTGEVDPDVPVVPPADDDLPNLQIADWGVSYDGRAGGEGTWEWEVINAGSGTAAAGADVNLMLSTDAQIDSTDWYVVYEEIQDTLAPGASIGRDASHARHFTFPDNLESGTYYLAMWVDDLQEIDESDESDNQSFGQDTISIAASALPDIGIDYWWADWDAAGNGVLEYTVVNNGVASTTRTDWDINLVLSQDEIPSASSAYFLFYEHANYILGPGESVYRDETSSASFNLFETQEGDTLPSGTYYLSLWVDDQGLEPEDNEINNLSVGNQLLDIAGGSVGSLEANPATSSLRHLETSGANGASSSTASKHPAFAFNGKRILSTQVMMQKVQITKDADGTRRMTLLETLPGQPTTQKRGAVSGEKVYAKVGHAADRAVFPRTRHIELSEAPEVNHEK